MFSGTPCMCTHQPCINVKNINYTRLQSVIYVMLQKAEDGKERGWIMERIEKGKDGEERRW